MRSPMIRIARLVTQLPLVQLVSGFAYLIFTPPRPETDSK